MRPSVHVSSAFYAAAVSCVLVGCSGGDAAPAGPEPDTAVVDSSAADTTADTTAPETSEPEDTLVADTQPPDTSVPPDTAVTDTATLDTATTDVSDAKDATDALADVASDLGTDAASSLDCGSAPYQPFDPLAALIVYDTPKTDVTVTANICPATSVAIPYKLQRKMNVQRSVPFFFIATQTGNLSNFSKEYNVTVSLFPKLIWQAQMLPATYPLTIDPAWDGTKQAFVGMIVNKATGAGACSTTDGVTYAVPGHPEAVIKYTGGGTSTSGVGLSNTWISLVTTGTPSAPEYVRITQTKAGCKVDLAGVDKLYLTGRAPIAINTVTYEISGEVMNP